MAITPLTSQARAVTTLAGFSLVCLAVQVEGFHVCQPSPARHLYSSKLFAEPPKEKGMLDFLFNPYESKIPEEIRKDIYEAEANTPAAKDRNQRVGLYALLAFSGILLAFFNGFLTELRTTPTPDGSQFDLDDAGFGWVTSNLVTSFLFTNKIGGFICLLGGGAAGLLAEAEYDTRRINAEKIFEELQRRREEKESSGGKKQKLVRKKKRRSGREKKRLSALSEVMSTQTPEPVIDVEEVSVSPEQPAAAEKKENKDGIAGKLQDFFDKADSMAASQALLLNKKLEDEGLIEKITDKTGLKVIGKDEAAKLKRTGSDRKE